jgi:hypothetical protein
MQLIQQNKEERKGKELNEVQQEIEILLRFRKKL